GVGTFDVTVLQRDHGIIDMKAFDGNHLLGGYNFDRKLIDWLRKQLETRGRKIEIDLKTDTGKAAVANLLRAAEGVKIKLAKAVDDEKMIEFRARGVINDVNGKDVPINERLCRKDFVKMIAHYINRTIESCNSALKKTELNTGDIHEVLLVGGSSYAPWITEAIKPLFPHLTPGLFLPDLCVGIGAAIHGNIILPKQSTINDYLIQLDIPERTSIETVNIIGEINCSNTNQLQKASIILKSSAGKQLDKTNFDSELKFFFSNIELMVLDGKNEYTLQVVDTNQNIILSHSFCIEHETEGSDTSTISTVLPQPLFIETYDGLVAIAKEGVALPARITQTFKRLNNNTNFEILLYQKDEKIGVIRVEDMPLEGGKGAFLDLDLHITQKNEIKGKVIIRKDDNGFKAEKIISLKYSVIEIPDTDALTDEINQLKARIKGLSVNVLQTEKNELSAETINIALELIQEAEKLLGQIPLERNEIYDLLKKIANILQPPQDDMQPSRKEFNALLNQCRETCTKLIKSTKGIADDDDSGKGLDKSMVESAGKSVHQAKVFLKRIDEIESKGIEVANKKNKRNWQILNNKLQRIRADIQKNDKLQTPPTIYNKLLAKKRIIRMLQKFFNACNRIESDGKIKDWELELKAIYYDLITALLSIHDLDDFLLDDEGLTLIRRIYHDQITNREIPERIDKIGSVI
ncbi:MAG: Hsp70 family protein, partial [Bacteroidetes bacterium]|nr:Hsp70 family protein [Bacteroidota bacterium]